MSERDDFGAFLLGFVVGALTGAVATLLLAPQSGDQTRTMIKEKAIELGDKVNINPEEMLHKAEAATADARARAEALAIEARNRGEELVKTARTGMEELGRKGQVVIEEQKARLSKAQQAMESENGKKPVEPLMDEPPAVEI